MKNNLFKLAFILLGFNLSAQDFGRVVVRNASASYPPFIVSINGVRVSNNYDSKIAFNYLDEKNYRIKLLQSGSGNILNFNLTSEPKYVSKYVINADAYGNYSLLLESKSLLSLEPETGGVTISNATVTPNNTNNIPVQPNITTTTLIPATNTVASTPSVIPPPAVIVTAMDAADFNERLNAVKREHFDRERLDKAKMVFAEENFSTSQVCTAMKVFSFDDAKVDFAKFAWHKTIDRKNFYKTHDQLSFGSNKKELSDYTKKNP
ncbi:MAG: DUF4476 domain-containing protein [Sphingobacteriaceae bacterium]|nr:DUF4476 domain-containing protein [Sphingobacteriaceae bacterium]